MGDGDYGSCLLPLEFSGLFEPFDVFDVFIV